MYSPEDALLKIRGVTGDIFHSVKLSVMMAVDNVATGVNFRTISAIFFLLQIFDDKREEFSLYCHLMAHLDGNPIWPLPEYLVGFCSCGDHI